MFILTVRIRLCKERLCGRLVTNVLQEHNIIFSHPNGPFLASSHVPFRQRQTRASRVVYNKQLTKKQLLHNFSS